MNKTILISGGNRGIGLAIANLLKGQGYNILSPGSKELEVSNPESIDNFIKAHFTAQDSLYGLINNAGVFHSSPLNNYSLEDWQRVIDINLTGSFLLCQKTLPLLQRNNNGRIIMISSVSADGEAYAPAYSASKAGLIGLTKSLAQELAKYDIQVNAVCPGWVRTDMAEAILHNEELVKNNLGATLQNRWIEPGEIAGLVSYLLSDQAKAITGQAINISAGLSS